ncbi:hypothetical protein ACF07V_36535 [Streptomyces sp. NPDC015661]|uniref:hypothetical protein n=1 Tax=Streptomyces sp. NPDC015661 TaxID=3364961 RepID=UPI003701C232
MDPMVTAAGTAVVSAMATSAWEQARDAVVALWRRWRPERAEQVGADLEAVRAEVLEARRAGDDEAERALAGAWQSELQRLVREDASMVAEVRRLLEERLVPVLPVEERTRIGKLVMKAEASGHARVFQAGRDQHITGS